MGVNGLEGFMYLHRSSRLYRLCGRRWLSHGTLAAVRYAVDRFLARLTDALSLAAQLLLAKWPHYINIYSYVV